MAVNKAQLFSGEVRVFISDTDTELPEYDDTTGALTFDSTGWIEVYSVGDVTLTYEKEVEPVKVNGILGKLKDIVIGESALIKFELAEYSFFSFEGAIGSEVFSTVAAGADQSGQDVLTVGNKSKLIENAICFYGQDEAGMYKLYHFPCCVSTGNFEKVFKHGHTAVACEFDVLANPTTGKLFYAYDMTAVPVS